MISVFEQHRHTQTHAVTHLKRDTFRTSSAYQGACSFHSLPSRLCLTWTSSCRTCKELSNPSCLALTSSTASSLSHPRWGGVLSSIYSSNHPSLTHPFIFSSTISSIFQSIGPSIYSLKHYLNHILIPYSSIRPPIIEPHSSTHPQQHYTPMSTTYGPLDRPFGPSRYQATRLLVCLLTLNYAPANLKLFELGTLGVLLVGGGGSGG